MRHFYLTCTVFVVLLGSSLALADEYVIKPYTIGYVQILEGEVAALNQDRLVKLWNGRSELRLLREMDPIHRMDTILTGPEGSCQIIFEDGSLLSLGPNSGLRIYEYAYDCEHSEENRLSIGFGIGIYRFLGGCLTERNPDATVFTTPLSTVAFSSGDLGMEITSSIGMEQAYILKGPIRLLSLAEGNTSEDFTTLANQSGYISLNPGIPEPGSGWPGQELGTGDTPPEDPTESDTNDGATPQGPEQDDSSSDSSTDPDENGGPQFPDFSELFVHFSGKSKPLKITVTIFGKSFYFYTGKVKGLVTIPEINLFPGTQWSNKRSGFGKLDHELRWT